MAVPQSHTINNGPIPDAICKRVGLLAARGNITIGLYQKEYQRVGNEVLVPKSQSQANIMEAIQRIK